MADRGGGDAQAYVRQHESIPSPIIKRDVIGPPRLDRVQDKKFASDNLTKYMAYEKLKKKMPFKSKSVKEYLEDAAIKTLDAMKLDEGTYNIVLAKVKHKIALGFTTDEYGVADLIKNELEKKDIDISQFPGGQLTGGELTFADTFKENPFKAKVTDTGKFEAGITKMFEAGITKLSEAEKAAIRERIGGPPSFLNPYREKSPLDAFTGHGSFADDEFTGAATFKPNDMFSVGTNFLDNELRWNAQLKSEDEKNKLKFTGKATDISGIKGTAGIFSGDYNLNTDAWKGGFDYPLNKYLSFVGNLDSQDKWNTALKLGMKWGQPEIPEPVRNQEPSELGKLLKQSEYYKGPVLEEDAFAKGGRVGMGKGGLASLNNYATKRTG